MLEAKNKPDVKVDNYVMLPLGFGYLEQRPLIVPAPFFAIREREDHRRLLVAI